MKPIKLTLVTFASALLLASCFGKEDSGKAGVGTPSPNGGAESPAPTQASPENSPARIEAEAKERARVSKLSELTSENLQTQLDTKGGKKTLFDRRLFINYLISKNVSTVPKLFEGLSEIKRFLQKQGIELTEPDILVIIAGSQIENPVWSVCGSYSATKKTLDSKNEFYPYVAKMCGDVPNSEASKK